MAKTAQISKEKQQSIITLRHEGQSIWNISRTLKVSSRALYTTKVCCKETTTKSSTAAPSRASCSAFDRNVLQSVARMAQYITVAKLPAS